MTSLAGPILITGASGQIGGALAQLSRKRGIEISAPDRFKLDLLDSESIRRAVAERPWAAVFNCAAYTAVDKAESDFEVALAVNANAPKVFAEETARKGIPLLHVSTDYVFDGAKSSPYEEEDSVNPSGIYGLTKEAGEAAVRTNNPKHAIVRTAWVVSADGTNFLNTMLRLATTQKQISVVNDQIGSPSSATDIASALLTVAEQRGDLSGTWHFVNSGVASWYDFANYIFNESNKRGLAVPKVLPISTSDYPTAAKRPANSRLSTQKISTDFALNPRAWEDAIGAVLVERLGQ